jgi:hypothetical protein
MANELRWWRGNVAIKAHQGSHWTDATQLRDANSARLRDGQTPRLSDDRVTDALALRLWDLGQRFFQMMQRGMDDNNKFAGYVGTAVPTELLACEQDVRPLARLARSAHVMRLVRRCHQHLDAATEILFPTTATPEQETAVSAGTPAWTGELAEARTERLKNLIAWREAQTDVVFDRDECVELLLLLKYSVREFEVSGRVGDSDGDGFLTAEVDEMREAIRMLKRVSGLKDLVVPVWFVPSFEVDIRRNTRHDTTLEIITETPCGPLSTDYVVREASIWSDLHHPNIAKFFGACHVGNNRIMLCENTVDILPSTTDEWWSTWRSCALVLLYLLERNMAFDSFSRDRIRLAHSQKKTVLLGNGVISLDQDGDGNGGDWPLPSRFMANVTSLAEMIQDSIKKVKVRRKSRLLRQLCSACLGESPSSEEALHALRAIASESDESPGGDDAYFQMVSNLDNPIAVVEIAIHFELKRVADVFKTMEQSLEGQTLSPNHRLIYESLCYVYGQMQTPQPPLSNPLLESLQRAVDRFYRAAFEHSPVHHSWGSTAGDNCLQAQREANDDFEILRDVANLCIAVPAPPNAGNDTLLRFWRAKLFTNRCLQLGGGDLANGLTDANAAGIARFELAKRSRYFGDGRGFRLEANPGNAAIPQWFIPPYEVEIREQLGEGGFATVCTGKWFNTDVVVKRVNCGNGAISTSQEAFKREADIWFSLAHPFVVKLYGACHLEGEQFFVCEYASQGTLMHFVNRKTETGEYVRSKNSRAKEAWRCLYDAALGLQYLHECGVTHCDLKSDNILVGVDGRARLTDFGLSAGAGHQTEAVTAAAYWTAPEVLLGRIPTSASDVYSFAMTIVEVRTGKRPWGGVTAASVRYGVKRGATLARPDCFSDAEWDLVQQMTCQEPRERLTMTVVVERLLAFTMRQ